LATFTRTTFVEKPAEFDTARVTLNPGLVFDFVKM
jgi:hypothetical protein